MTICDARGVVRTTFVVHHDGADDSAMGLDAFQRVFDFGGHVFDGPRTPVGRERRRISTVHDRRDVVVFTSGRPVTTVTVAPKHVGRTVNVYTEKRRHPLTIDKRDIDNEPTTDVTNASADHGRFGRSCVRLR